MAEVTCPYLIQLEAPPVAAQKSLAPRCHVPTTWEHAGLGVLAQLSWDREQDSVLHESLTKGEALSASMLSLYHHINLTPRASEIRPYLLSSVDQLCLTETRAARELGVCRKPGLMISRDVSRQGDSAEFLQRRPSASVPTSGQLSENPCRRAGWGAVEGSRGGAGGLGLS